MNKIKKILILLIIILVTSLIIRLIYNKIHEETFRYSSIGDGLSLGINDYDIETYNFNSYINDHFKSKNIKIQSYNHSKKNIKILDLLKELLYRNNKELINEIRNSKIVIISIGEYELLHNYSPLDIKNDLKDLIIEIKKYNSNIYLLGRFNNIYTSDRYINEVNQVYKECSDKENIKYIDIKKVSKYLDTYHYYPNYKGYKYIANSIIDSYHSFEE